MKTLLINSPWIQEEERYGVKAGARWASIRRKKETLMYYPFPFFMAYAAAYLKSKGHEARLKDSVAEGQTAEEALQSVEEYGPAICVIETSTPSIYHDLKFAEKVKQNSGIFVALCGPHASALPEEVLQNSYVDAVLYGEYDYTLEELVRKHQETKGVPDLSSIQGLAWKDKADDDRTVVNPRRPLIKNLDTLPYPERDDVPLEKYTDPTCKRFPNVCIIGSRGCPNQCIFCLEPSVFYGPRPGLRLRKAELVVDEIEFIMQKYQVEEIYFDDASFSLNTDWSRRIAEEILKRKLDLYWSCMADSGIDLDTLQLMKKSGCRGVKFGVESADPEILKKAKKPLSLENVKKFVRDCKTAGIYTHGTFMFGLPGETRESIEQTIDFAFSLKLTTAQFSVATPFPGTQFYKMAKENGWLITDDWSKFEGAGSPVIEYPQCSKEDIIRGVSLSKKRKLLRVAYNPRIFVQYVKKIYDMEGVAGVLRNLWDKGSFIIRSGK